MKPTDRLPAAAMAELLGLTTARLRQLATAGAIPAAERGRYQVGGTVRGYLASLRKPAPTARGSFVELARAKRVRLHRRTANEAAQLVPGADVERALARTAEVVKRSLRPLEAKALAAEFAAIGEPAAVRLRLLEVVNRARTSAADELERVIARSTKGGRRRGGHAHREGGV